MSWCLLLVMSLGMNFAYSTEDFNVKNEMNNFVRRRLTQETLLSFLDNLEAYNKNTRDLEKIISKVRGQEDRETLRRFLTSAKR